MPTISSLWQAQDQAALHQALLQIGLYERIKPLQTKTKRWGPKAAPAAPEISTTRTIRLIEGLAKGEDERTALLAVLDGLLDDFSHSADPFRALLNFSRLADVVEDRAAFLHDLHEHHGVRKRLCTLLGFSQALADTLERQPELLDLLRHHPTPLSRPELRRRAGKAVADGTSRTEKLDGLRRFRRAHSFRIGLLDMERQTWRKAADFKVVVRQISDLAQVIVQTTLEVLGSEFDTSGFVVLAMGKLGARELNYWSDIDLMFVAEGDNPDFRSLGETLFKELTETTAAGTLYRVDMRLRPEGSTGPLVTPFSYALGYYESFAAAWEWQALIKTRAIAGDARLGRRFRKFTRGVTWAKRPDDAHLRAVVEMKKRSEATPEGSDATNVKQGPGAIRDAEWVVQQLQMMVGPTHPRARVPDTLGAINALRSFKALTEREARELREGYMFLRVIEHRLQLLDERAIRTLPTDEHERAALARRLGYRARSATAAMRMEEDLTRYRGEIRALCERLFWGWTDAASDKPASTTSASNEVLEEGASLPPQPQKAPAISAPNAARLQRMAHGSPSHPFPAPLARQINAALPPVLAHLDHTADPERALTNLERLCDASGNRLSLLRALGEAPEFARAVMALLGGSAFLADTLIRSPELMDLAAHRPLLAEPKTWEQARTDCRSYCLTFRDRAAAMRRWKRRELLRIGLRDLALNAPPHEITREIADLARACLALAVDETGILLRPESESIRFAVLGMGKLGGAEMHYASDCDVIFVYEAPSPWEGAANAATRRASETIRWMGKFTEEGSGFEVDARLRPYGQSGALAPSLAAFHEYFEDEVRGVAVWERQALTRARFVAGDAEIAASLLAAVRHVAFPETWRAGWGDELRHIKARVESERGGKSAPRGKGEIFDVKLGKGALSDIEFCAQWLALKFGARFPHLQTTNTRDQIEMAQSAGLLGSDEATALLNAHTFLRRVELRLQLTQDHSGHAARRDSKEFIAWSRAVFPDESTQVATERFESQWHEFTQTVRTVMERVRGEL